MNKPTLIKQIKSDDHNQFAVFAIPVGPDRSISPTRSQWPLFFQPVYTTKSLSHPNHFGLMMSGQRLHSPRAPVMTISKPSCLVDVATRALAPRLSARSL